MMTLYVHIHTEFVVELPCDGHTDWPKHVAGCVKIMWYNGDVKRLIWSVIALNSVAPNDGTWNESSLPNIGYSPEILQ